MEIPYFKDNLPSSGTGPEQSRLEWVDIMKGLSILWIVYFHFFSAYDSGRYPWPLTLDSFSSFLNTCAPSSFMTRVCCASEAILAGLFQRGPSGVAVFIVLSGFSLSYALLRGDNDTGGWLQWYRRRLLRLFPMYWVAHMVYLISPLIQRKETIDYRFLLSLLGDRVLPVDTMFYYINPSWWFFGLLLELYVVFPFLFSLLKKLGTAKFLCLCGLITIASRYLLFGVLHAHGNYVQGAFFGARLWEFAFGMAVAMLYHKYPHRVEKGIFSPWGFIGGLVLYQLGLYSYQPGFTYALTDALGGTGMFLILALSARFCGHIPLLRTALSFTGIYSYGLYLLHQPYVIYLGERWRGFSMAFFLVGSTLVLSILSLGAAIIEKRVNKVANLVFNYTV